MNDNAVLNHIFRRAYRYEYASGLSEATIGCLLLVAAVALQFGYSGLGLGAGGDDLRPVFLALILIVLVALGAWAIFKSAEALRERIIYPRTGYVQYRRDDPERKRFSQWASWLAAALGVFLSQYGDSVFLLLGLLLSFGLLFYGRKTGLVRLYIHALVVVASAFALLLLGVDRESRNVLYPAAVGLYLLIAGGLALWRYLTHFKVEEPQS